MRAGIIFVVKDHTAFQADSSLKRYLNHVEVKFLTVIHFLKIFLVM